MLKDGDLRIVGEVHNNGKPDEECRDILEKLAPSEISSLILNQSTLDLCLVLNQFLYPTKSLVEYDLRSN